MSDTLLCTDQEITKVLESYANMLYRLAFSWTKNSSDAEDILQEVFIKYIKARKVFVNDEHLKAWLIRLTINCCKNLLRSPWFKKRIEQTEETGSSHLQIQWDVYNEVLELPQKYRLVIHLYYYEDYSVKEISHLLKSKESTVKSQLKRARTLLKNKLEEEIYVTAGL